MRSDQQASQPQVHSWAQRHGAAPVCRALLFSVVCSLLMAEGPGKGVQIHAPSSGSGACAHTHAHARSAVCQPEKWRAASPCFHVLISHCHGDQAAPDVFCPHVPPPVNPLLGAEPHFSGGGDPSFSYQLKGLFTYKGCNPADTLSFKLCVFNFNVAKSINYGF